MRCGDDHGRRPAAQHQHHHCRGPQHGHGMWRYVFYCVCSRVWTLQMVFTQIFVLLWHADNTRAASVALNYLTQDNQCDDVASKSSSQSVVSLRHYLLLTLKSSFPSPRGIILTWYLDNLIHYSIQKQNFGLLSSPAQLLLLEENMSIFIKTFVDYRINSIV